MKKKVFPLFLAAVLAMCASCAKPADKNKLFLETKLSELTTTDKIYDFTYPEIL